MIQLIHDSGSPPPFDLKTLVLAGGKVKVNFDALDDAPQDTLLETINYMIEHCRDSIINHGAELARIQIRNAMGVY